MKNFIQQFRNAKTCIAQIRRGEWVPEYNIYSRKHLTARRKGLELWLGNGAFFCDIDNTCFGLIWRHLVWWAAARKLRRDADRVHHILVLE